MNKKDVVLSVILNAFLGYLWVLFTSHVIGMANSMDNVLVGGVLILFGTYLFMEIFQRVTPYHQLKSTHPVKIIGFSSFVVVVLANVLH